MIDAVQGKNKDHHYAERGHAITPAYCVYMAAKIEIVITSLKNRLIDAHGVNIV